MKRLLRALSPRWLAGVFLATLMTVIALRLTVFQPEYRISLYRLGLVIAVIYFVPALVLSHWLEKRKGGLE